MFRPGEILRDNKGAVFNLVLSLLVISFGPYYIREVKLIRDLGHTNFFIAFILFIFILAEPWALYTKINSIYVNDHAKRDLTGRYIFLWIAHIVVTVMTVMVMGLAMPRELKFVNLPLFWLVGIKEFVLVGYLINRQVTDEARKNDGVWKQPRPISGKRVFIADIILSVYAFLMFGITWQSMGASGFLGGMMNDLADSYVFRIFTFTIMFFVIYFPIRMGHFIEEWLTMRTPTQKKNYWLSFAVTMVSCIGPLFTGGPAPSKEHINDRNSEGKTPLIQAVEYEPLPYIQRLIDNGADLDAQDTTGRTALHYTAMGGRVEVMKLLLENGANPNIQQRSGGTALGFAAGFLKTDAMKLLLTHHADPNIAYYDGETPLMEAAYQGFDPEGIELLLKYGANGSQQDTIGWCAIAYFSHMHNIQDPKSKKILDLLLQHTDLQMRDKKGHTLVWHAMRYNGWPYTDIGIALANAGAAVDSSDYITADGWDQFNLDYIRNEKDSTSQ